MDRESETLTTAQKYNEFVLTAIRTMWGVDLNRLKEKFGMQQYDYCMKNLQKQMDWRKGLMSCIKAKRVTQI